MHRRKALIIDDNLSAREMVASQLEGMGCSVGMPRSGERALRLPVEGPRPDPVVLDNNVDGKADMWFLDQLRLAGDSLGEKTPPVVVLSDDQSFETERSARAAGAGVFMLKPVDDTFLGAVFEHLLSPADGRKG